MQYKMRLEDAMKNSRHIQSLEIAGKGYQTGCYDVHEYERRLTFFFPEKATFEAGQLCKVTFRDYQTEIDALQSRLDEVNKLIKSKKAEVAPAKAPKESAIAPETLEQYESCRFEAYKNKQSPVGQHWAVPPKWLRGLNLHIYPIIHLDEEEG